MSSNSQESDKKGDNIEASAEEKLATLNKAHQDTKLELEQTQQVNADLQNRVEELEQKLAKAGQIPAAEVAEKVTIPEKSFNVKFDDKVTADGTTNHKEKSGDYVFTIPKFTNPLDGHSPITAAEALTNKELLHHLVKEKFGGIKRKGAK